MTEVLAGEPCIAVAATFTAQPLDEALAYWLRRLDLPHRPVFAPYNQVFQQLLDPSSLLAGNRRGINVVLLRFADWGGAPDRSDAVADLVEAVRTSVSRTGAPHLIVVCAPLDGAARQAAPTLLDPREEQLRAGLATTPGAYVLGPAELATYAVERGDDPGAEELAHVPFTRLFFAAMGTLIARKIHAIVTPPYKVIALDCDDTLWRGVCGEDGPLGVEIDHARRDLQAFMLTMHGAGLLLCLCSKNNEEDVLEVFRQRPDMLVRQDHLVAWRLNWEPKSANLRSLAAELGLGLDSFVFIDDNPLECEEVRAHCPEVLTLQLPADAGAIPTFLRHVWAFDRLRVTADDQRRSARYRDNARRERFRHQSASLPAFLAALHLDVRFAPLGPEHLARAAQLTQRTNQFNCAAIRRTEGELQTGWQTGRLEGLAVDVSDRFGDYGTVGLLLFAADGEALMADTFLLSCRAMGRGVEHRMLARLGEIALQRGLPHVVVAHRPTGKNAPARAFLAETGAQAVAPDGASIAFRWCAAAAAATVYSPPAVAPTATDQDEDEESSAPGEDSGRTAARMRSALLSRIAVEASDARGVLEAIRLFRLRARPALDSAFVAPRTPLEEIVAGIWGELFDIEPIGTDDNFFELGGHSLLATLIVSRIREALDVDLPVTAIFEAPTVAELAVFILESQVAERGGDDVESLFPARGGATPSDAGARRGDAREPA